MEKVYTPQEEKKCFSIGKENNLFTAAGEPAAPAFSMISPPAGIAGTPLIGPAFTFTIQDILARRKRMQGFSSSWLPGLEYTSLVSQVKEMVSLLGLTLAPERIRDFPTQEISTLLSRAFVRLYKDGMIYCHTAAEKQWFLETPALAKQTREVVEKGEITFFPEKWSHLYLDWLDNCGDWCISRRAALGQDFRIPVYECLECSHQAAAESPPVKCSQCGANTVEPVPYELDRRFVLALWPSLPAPVPPASLLTVGRDLFFSWAARMIMMRLYFHNTVPCREILIIGFPQDEHGLKMCAAKNNIMDPLETIAAYGADPLRFSLAARANPGKDISIDLNRVKGYKAFASKIYQAGRFILMNLKGDEDFNIDFDKTTPTDKWILHSLDNIIPKINEGLDNYRIGATAHQLYHFFWHVYCDWYLEFSKNDLRNRDSRKTLKFTFYILLQLLHPFIPFITEALYQKIKGDGSPFLLQTDYPSFNSRWVFAPEFGEVEVLKKVIAGTRKTRARNNIHPGHRIRICLKTDSEKEKAAVAGNIKYFDALTRSAFTEIVTDFPAMAKGFKGACLNWEILLPFDSDEDRLQELNRLHRRLEKIEKKIASLEKKVASDRFVTKSPETMVFQLKKNLQEAIDQRNHLQKNIHDLS